MAVALDADQEALTYFSFPIEKQEDTAAVNPVDGTPDIWITGKATDGTVDADRQIVDPEWSAVALKEWAATGGNVRMAHDPKRPVGKGHDVQVTMDGHYVKALISDPLAKHFIRQKVLNDYSVGISMPHIKFGPHKTLDPRGEATGGIITGRPDGLSKIAELSVVDRGSNFHSKFQITRKSAGGGDDFGFIGKMVGESAEIEGAAPPDLLAKVAGNGLLTKGGDGSSAAEDLVSVDLPATMSLSVSPADLAKMNTLSRQRAVRSHYDELAANAVPEPLDGMALKAVADAEAAVLGKDHREFSADQRRQQASSGNALPDGSYPVPDKDALRRAAILARSGHGNVAAARRLIARRARELGVPNPLDESDAVKKGSGKKGGGGGVNVPAAEPVTEKAGGALDDKALAALKALQDAMLALPVAVDASAAAKEAEPDLTKSCSACSAGNCDGAACSCGKCTDGKCACGKSAQKAAAKPKPVKKAAKKPKGTRKLPPWLNKPSGDGDGDDDASKACKSAADHIWAGILGSSDVVCSKCHTTPAQAAGVTASPMAPAPVGELQESSPPSSVKGATPQSAGGVQDSPAMSPVPAHREPDGTEVEAFEADSGMGDGDNEAPNRLEAPTLKASPEVLALLRFKAAGIDTELGKLHDLTCPAYHPDEVAKYHPFADLGSLIDEAHWQRKALESACGPLEAAIAMQELTAAAFALKAASEADVNDWRLEAHKAFRDANPGPGTYPTPGAVSPRKYTRPLITDGRSATSTGHSGPNTSPVVATMAPNATSFDRPPLSDGQQNPSPSFMKWDSGQYPDRQGVPTQLNYAHLKKDRQRMALVLMHDHLSRQFPEVCPLDNVDLSGRTDRPLRGVQPEHHPVPATAGIGKGGNDSSGEVTVSITKAGVTVSEGVSYQGPPAAAPANGYVLPKTAPAAAFKGFKKQRKKLGKKVLAGKMTVDEARAQMGRRFAQKAAEPPAEAVQKAAAVAVSPVTSTIPGANVTYTSGTTGSASPYVTLQAPAATPAPVAASLGPAEIEAAVTKAVAPLLEKIRQQDETYTAKLAETQRVIDAIADQPDPSTASFSGLAFQPVRKAARPAGVTDIAEAAARARRATERELENIIDSASDPYQREAARASLTKMMGGLPQ